DVTVTEGAAGTTTLATFTVTLSTASTQTVGVNFATANDTATAGSDYVAKSGVLTFAPGGALAKTIAVTVNGDNKDEIDEQFFVRMNHTIAALFDEHRVATITADDPPPTFSSSDVTVAEGASGTSTLASFTVSLSAASGKTITVNYATANGTINP